MIYTEAMGWAAFFSDGFGIGQTYMIFCRDSDGHGFGFEYGSDPITAPEWLL